MSTTRKKKSSYCHNCIKVTDKLIRTEACGRFHWLCERCADPMPSESYRQSDLRHDKVSFKAWGPRAYCRQSSAQSLAWRHQKPGHGKTH